MFQAPLLGFTKSLVNQIALDYNLPLDELITKYTQNAVRPICPFNTGKGTPCKNLCIEGCTSCHLHIASKPVIEKVEPIKKEPKKKSKTHPTHNHPIGTSVSTCPLCQSHGSCFDQNFPIFVILPI